MKKDSFWEEWTKNISPDQQKKLENAVIRGCILVLGVIGWIFYYKCQN